MVGSYLSTKIGVFLLMVSEKTRFTRDVRATTLALLTQSSRAKN